MRKIELEVPVEDMEEADLRATLAEVVEAHNNDVEEYDELSEQVEQAAAYSEQIEALEGQISEFRAYFAQKGSEVTGISEEVLAERFEPNELVEFAQKYDEQLAADFAAEAEAEAEEVEEEAEFSEGDEEEQTSLFVEKPSKVGDFSEPEQDRLDAAKERLAGVPGISLD